MPVPMGSLLADLTAETAVVDRMVAALPPMEWDRATPAAGWAIRDQISHLAYFDEAATLASTLPDEFRASAEGLAALGPDFPDQVALQYRDTPSADLLSWFRDARASLTRAFAGVEATARLPWYGPDMSAASSVTARLMETWAHGQDIADALGLFREPTSRLRHIAHLGVRTFGFSFALHGLAVPHVPPLVELTGPSGETWSWGPVGAADTVSGPALDFCLVVTQRRQLADTDLRVTGPVAAKWMSIAQAFAGAPGPGRPRRRDAR
ncbi:MAG: TIGR03084 family metal-binding protein [Acidimicrobiales bacterium]